MTEPLTPYLVQSLSVLSPPLSSLYHLLFSLCPCILFPPLFDPFSFPLSLLLHFAPPSFLFPPSPVPSSPPPPPLYPSLPLSVCSSLPPPLSFSPPIVCSSLPPPPPPLSSPPIHLLLPPLYPSLPLSVCSSLPPPLSFSPPIRLFLPPSLPYSPHYFLIIEVLCVISVFITLSSNNSMFCLMIIVLISQKEI